MLVIRLINENLQCEMNLEPFDFQLITATLGINPVKEPINKKKWFMMTWVLATGIYKR